MSEYNIQMNKYNALNAGYDQLYPQPMKHANTHAKDGNDPITPSMIGTYNKTEIDTALQNKADKDRVVNPNLLDNWYFGNPVNQRGQTSYTGEVYGIDRWIAQWTGDGVTLIEDGCISIDRVSHDSHICQRITDDLGGQIITLSVIGKGNFIISLVECDSEWVAKSRIAHSGKIISDSYALFTITGVVPQGCKNLLVEFASESGVKSQFKAAKLELGDQQTLAHQENGNWVLNEIPNYGEQLARCQRYFQLYSSADLRPAKAVDCRPTMRADPSQSTIVVNSTTYYYNTADL